MTEELKANLKQVQHILKNGLTKKHIMTFLKEYVDYDILVKSIDSYIDNFEVIEDSDADDVLLNLSGHLKHFISNTKNKTNIELYYMELLNDINFFIEYKVNGKDKDIEIDSIKLRDKSKLFNKTSFHNKMSFIFQFLCQSNLDRFTAFFFIQGGKTSFNNRKYYLKNNWLNKDKSVLPRDFIKKYHDYPFSKLLWNNKPLFRDAEHFLEIEEEKFFQYIQSYIKEQENQSNNYPKFKYIYEVEEKHQQFIDTYKIQYIENSSNNKIKIEVIKTKMPNEIFYGLIKFENQTIQIQIENDNKYITIEANKINKEYCIGLSIIKDKFSKDSNSIITSKHIILSQNEIKNSELEVLFKINETVSLEKLSIKIPNNFKIKTKSDIEPVLGVETVAEVLSSIIVNQPNDSGMMIGIFGKWGRGKTYLAEKTWKKLEEKKPKYRRIIFSAWKYQDTKSSWAYLYENCINEYLIENEELGKVKKYWNKTKKIWKLNLEKHTWFPVISFGLLFGLAIVWSFFINKIWLVKSLISIFGLVVFIKLFFLYLQQKTSAIGLYQRYFTRKSYSENLGFQSEIENELTNLLKTWIPKSNKDEKIVLFVDDIDRCNIEQVIAIIDGLRVILDNPEIHERLIIITAIDEKILQEALKHKYESIKDSELDLMYKEYLEKIFLIGLKLNELNSYEIEDFLINILPEKQEEPNTDNVNLGDNTYINFESTKNTYKNIEEDSPSMEESTKIEKSDYEITNEEREYLIKIIKTLENTTPRKIRIFYYKYLIMKQLFHIRLEEKGLIKNWNDESDEKIIADILVYLANGNNPDEFENDKDVKVIDELKYVAEMVSVL